MLQRKYSEGDILAALRQAAAEGQELTILAWQTSGRHPGLECILRRFGGWKNALDAAGLEHPWDCPLGDAEIVAALRQAAAQGQAMTEPAWRQRGCIPYIGDIKRRFGSWAKALETAGIPSHQPKYSNADIIAALQKAAREGQRMTAPAWLASGRSPTCATITRRFCGWIRALRAADIEPNPDGIRQAGAWDHIRDAARVELLQEMREVARRLGHAPTLREWNRLSSPLCKSNTISIQFGSWAAAWAAAGIFYERKRNTPRWSAPAVLEALRAVYTETGRIPTKREWTQDRRHPVVQVVIRRFASWEDAWEQAIGANVAARTMPNSLPARIRRQSNLDINALPPRYAEIITALQRGESLQAIGDRLGLTRERIRQLAAKSLAIASGAQRPQQWRRWSEKDMLEALRAAHAETGRTLSPAEWTAYSLKPCCQTISRRFGGWAQAWEAAGFPGYRRHRAADGQTDGVAAPVMHPSVPTRQAMLDSLRQAYAETGQPWSIVRWVFSARTPTYPTIIREFGSWSRAWETAVGVRPIRGASRIPEHAILRALRDAYVRNGRALSRTEWQRARLRPTVPTIVECLGSWRQAWEAALSLESQAAAAGFLR